MILGTRGLDDDADGPRITSTVTNLFDACLTRCLSFPRHGGAYEL